MNRAKKEETPRCPEFREAFLELMGDMTLQEFADKLGMSRATVGFYAAGKRIPDALGIKTIANRCNVSADWLVGLSDSRSTDKDIQNAVRTTGLSDKAVSSLKEMNNGNVELLSEIIENIRMDKFLWNFRSYVYLRRAAKKADHSEWEKLNSIREKNREDMIDNFSNENASDVIELYLKMRENLGYSSLIQFYFQKAKDDFEEIMKRIGWS